MIEPYYSTAVRRLAKARGQVETVQKMVDEGRYCMDVLQQVNAAIGLLQGVRNAILESHLHTCGSALQSKNTRAKEKFVQEILRACNVSQRS